MIAQVADEHPGLWEAIGDEMRTQRARRYTTRGAVVRDWPPTRDAVTQAGSTAMWDAAVQAVPVRRDAQAQVPARNSGAFLAAWDVATQTEPVALPIPGGNRTEGHAVVAEAAAARGGIGAHGKAPVDHRSAPIGGPLFRDARDLLELRIAGSLRAPLSRTAWGLLLPTRCGRPETTVRQCPDCRSGWYAQGPYVPGKGHGGPAPQRRRGGPPGARRGPY